MHETDELNKAMHKATFNDSEFVCLTLQLNGDPLWPPFDISFLRHVSLSSSRRVTKIYGHLSHGIKYVFHKVRLKQARQYLKVVVIYD